MTCKDCISLDVCAIKKKYYANRPLKNGHIDKEQLKYMKGVEKTCNHFKNKARFVELPCSVGDTFYAIVNEQVIAYNCVGVKYGHSAVTRKNNELLLLTVYDMEFVFGEEAFLSNEEAEAKLKELNENEMSI